MPLRLQLHYHKHAHHDVTVDLPRELGERQHGEVTSTRILEAPRGASGV